MKYSDTDTNVLIRELSTGISLRAKLRRDRAGAAIQKAQPEG